MSFVSSAANMRSLQYLDSANHTLIFKFENRIYTLCSLKVTVKNRK